MWSLLLALRNRVREPGVGAGASQGFTADGRLCPTGSPDAVGTIQWTGLAWHYEMPGAQPLLDLYLPCVEPLKAGSRVLGHLGQGIDGCIATASGDSSFVNDAENIVHLHRLRALHDAVIVGAATIAADNPQLTTRHVDGPDPVRIVLDPGRRLPASAGVFADGVTSTLLVVAESAGGPPEHGQAEVLFVPGDEGQGLDLRQLLTRLEARGLRRIFVEGGGKTVSRFQDAGLLDRLQIAVAPVLTGQGVPGLRLSPRERMQDCPRPLTRVFAMGQDILFDLDLRSGATADTLPRGKGLSRIA